MNRKTEISMRHLCLDLWDYGGTTAYQDILLPWLLGVRHVLADMARYRTLNTIHNPYLVTDQDLYQWYALGRCNDFLLRVFESMPNHYGVTPKDRVWRQIITPDEYLNFFRMLEFEIFANEGDYLALPQPFAPFYHEIVEVIEDPNWLGDPVAEHAYWPGLLFGQMMFSRAGVRVRCRSGDLNKQIAETSRLYFTYSRLHRSTEDLSYGWGHNSQWVTDFRRDYDTGDAFHYNVDAEHPLGDANAYRDSFTGEDYVEGADCALYLGDLTMEEHIELLTNRCFIRCTKSESGDSSFWNSYVETKSAMGQSR